jgi:hypothetical protein
MALNLRIGPINRVRMSRRSRRVKLSDARRWTSARGLKIASAARAFEAAGPSIWFSIETAATCEPSEPKMKSPPDPGDCARIGDAG